VAFARLSSADAVAWLRQKTRTSSSPADQQGEWTDASIVADLNAAIREIATRMMATPWLHHFLVEEPGVTTAGGSLIVGASLSPAQAAAAVKVAFVRIASSGLFVPRMGTNRLIYTATYGARQESGSPIGNQLFYVPIGFGHTAEPPDSRTRLLFFGNSGEITVNVFFYAMPAVLAAAPSGSDFIGLPQIAWNSMLSYALMLMCEDDRNAELRGWAAERFSNELPAMLMAAPADYDMPDGLLGPAEVETR